jgi:hypothetical protein
MSFTVASESQSIHVLNSGKCKIIPSI